MLWVCILFIDLLFIYIKNMKPIFIRTFKKWRKTDETIFTFYKKVIINYDYYKEEIKCMNDNVPKNAVLTQEDKDRLHERPYFTFVEANRSSLSNNLFL